MYKISDNYVHRLVASKTDGKIVQYECEGDTCQEEKIDSLQLEVGKIILPTYVGNTIYNTRPKCNLSNTIVSQRWVGKKQNKVRFVYIQDK